MNVAILLFEEFETLDVFGPVEIFGRLKDRFRVTFYANRGGIIRNSHGIAMLANDLAEIENGVDIFLIPGGHGTRIEVNNIELITRLRNICEKSKFVLTVCTGTALLARTGLLDGKKATSNKKAFDWVVTQGENVTWIRKARWVRDGKFYTSAGVSAGMDMTLGVLSDIHGLDFARQTAFDIEYDWVENMEEDKFFHRYDPANRNPS